MIVTRYGMDEEFGKISINKEHYKPSQIMMEKVDKAIERLIKETEIKTRKLIEDNEVYFHKIAKTLYDNETLLEEDIKNIMKD